MASAEYHRQWRARNLDKVKVNKAKYNAKPGIKAKNAAYSAKQRQNNPNRFIADLHKAAPCNDCGGRFPAPVMEFDHRDASTKTDAVAVLARKRNLLPSALMAEIAKCDVVCANCHRIRTLNRHLDTKSDLQRLSGTNATTLPPPPSQAYGG